MIYRKRGPRAIAESAPLYALLDDRPHKDALSPVQSRWHCDRAAPVGEAGAKHRAAWRANAHGAGMLEMPVVPAWRRNVAARNQKIFRRF